MKHPVHGIEMDERFVKHRLHAGFWACMGGAMVAAGLATYRLLAENRFEWDLIVVLGAIILIELSVIAWYRFKG